MGADSAEVRIAAGKHAAERVFPDKVDMVETLASDDPNFRDMCEELAEFDAALKRVRCLGSPIREERIQECLDWIDRITGEMEDRLRAKRVDAATMLRIFTGE